MRQNKNIEMTVSNPIWIYLKGVVSAYIFSLIVFIIMALLITYTSMSETIIPLMTTIVMIISVSVSGMYSGMKIKRKGWLNGGIAGLIYIIWMIFMSWVFIEGFSFDKYALFKILIGAAGGGIGGMIGVNLK
ncbi:MAG: TIGR04086 family membrane protein [Bacillota bacterium]